MEKKEGEAAFIKNSRQMGIYFCCCIKEFFTRQLLLASLVVCTLLPVAGFQALEASVILFIV